MIATRDATFGFPEIRRKALPGLVSVAARRRLSVAACERMMCSGDSVDAAEAHRLGLADFVGDASEIENEVHRVLARYRQLGASVLVRSMALLADRPRRALVRIASNAHEESGDASPLATGTVSPCGRIAVSDESGVAVVDMPKGRPDAALFAALLAATLRLEATAKLRAVVLTSGMAEQETAALEDARHCGVSPLDDKADVACVEEVIEELYRLGVPLITCVDGTLKGSTLQLFLCADYRVASASTVFVLGEIDCADSTRVRELIGEGGATKLCAAEHVSAEAARAVGLASEVLGDSATASYRAMQLAGWLAAAPTVGQKHMLRLTRFEPLDQADPEASLELGRTVRVALQGSEVRSTLSDTTSAQTHEASLLDLLPRLEEERAKQRERIAVGQSLRGWEQRRSLLRGAMATLRAPALPPTGPRLRPEGGLAVGRGSGIAALELYTPRHCVSAVALEGVSGTPGNHDGDEWLASEYGGIDDTEDTVSMALTVVMRLLRRASVDPRHVGMLQVGSQSLMDRSKSLKSELMALFEAEGDLDEKAASCNVEGVDNYHAANGGALAALLNCIQWSESPQWDGRWAVAVCCDVGSGSHANGRFDGGAAATAVLVGPSAPARLEHVRSVVFAHDWATCQPITGPAIFEDDALATARSHSALDACSRKLGLLSGCEPELGVVESTNYLDGFVGYLASKTRARGRLSRSSSSGLREARSAPLLTIASRVGFRRSANLCMGICSLLTSGRPLPAAGCRISCFAYDSARVSTLGVARLLPGSALPCTDARGMLAARTRHEPAAFLALLRRHASTCAGSAPKYGWSIGAASHASEWERDTVRLLSTDEDALRLYSRPDQLSGRRELKYARELAPPPAPPVQSTAATGGAPNLTLALLAQLLGGSASLPVATNESVLVPPTSITIVSASALVQEVASDLIGSAVDADIPLMEAGMDSLAAVEFRSRLSERLGSAELSETVIFDFPTARELATHIEATVEPPPALVRDEGSSALQTPAAATALGSIDPQMLLTQLQGLLTGAAKAGLPAAAVSCVPSSAASSLSPLSPKAPPTKPVWLSSAAASKVWRIAEWRRSTGFTSTRRGDVLSRGG